MICGPWEVVRKKCNFSLKSLKIRLHSQFAKQACFAKLYNYRLREVVEAAFILMRERPLSRTRGSTTVLHDQPKII